VESCLCAFVHAHAELSTQQCRPRQNYSTDNGKVFPLQARCGPEGGYRYSSTHPWPRGWMVSSTPWQQFTPGKEPVPILQEARWDPGPVWTGGKSRPHRDSIPERPARSRYTDWATGPTAQIQSIHKSSTKMNNRTRENWALLRYYAASSDNFLTLWPLTTHIAVVPHR